MTLLNQYNVLVEVIVRINLLVAIKKKGISQRQFAHLVGEHESIVSRVITGKWNPDNKQREKYAKILGEKVSALFAS